MGKSDHVRVNGSGVHNPGISDLHATICFDYEKMQFNFNGRTFHLVEEGEGPIADILS